MSIATENDKNGEIDRRYFTSKTETTARLFAVLNRKSHNCEIKLTTKISHIVGRGDVLELIVTTKSEACSNSEINNVHHIGLVEVSETGLLLCDDSVSVLDKKMGNIIGFYKNPLSNHLNIVMQCDNIKTGKELGLPLDALITFSGIHEDIDDKIGF